MKIFTKLYDLTLSWSKHPKAPVYLGAMSFAESSFFPIPPDVMLMPMCLAKPKQAYYFAFITTLFSVLGGILGYVIGATMLDIIWPLIESINYVDKYYKIEQFFANYGIWIVFLAGFSPVPYKVVTIAAGATSMALLPFIIASLIGRASRFYLVAFLIKFGSERYEQKIRQYVDWIGYAMVILIMGFIAYKYV